MGIASKAGATIAQGFFFGLGFSVAVWGAYYTAYSAWPKQGRASIDESYTSVSEPTTPTASRENIVISNVEEQKSNDRAYFLGIAKNAGARPFSNVQIEVDLFKQAKFVDQYSTYLSGSIAPGETRYFKIACGCKDSPPAEHDSYKIHVVGGY